MKHMLPTQLRVGRPDMNDPFVGPRQSPSWRGTERSALDVDPLQNSE